MSDTPDPSPAVSPTHPKGHGLSLLQRFILNHVAAPKGLLYAAILEEFYGWKPLKPGQPYIRRGQLYHRFSRKQIGETEYRKVMATLSRTCRRLEQRGLVERITDDITQWSGIRLTHHGLQYLCPSPSIAAQSVNPCAG